MSKVSHDNQIDNNLIVAKKYKGWIGDHIH